MVKEIVVYQGPDTPRHVAFEKAVSPGIMRPTHKASVVVRHLSVLADIFGSE